MDPHHLHEWLSDLSVASPMALMAVAVAGLVMGVAPSSLPLFSVVIGYVAGKPAEAVGASGAQPSLRGFVLSSGFVLGMASVDTVIGGLSGLIGGAVIAAVARYVVLTNLLIALLLAGLGLALLRKIRIVVPVLTPALRRIETFPGAFALGVPFGLSTCPACTPMILPILAAAAATGTIWIGAALMFVFGLARGLPLILAGTLTGTVRQVHRLAFWVPRLERAGGVLLLIAASYFLYESAVAAGIVPPLAYLFRT